MKKLLFSMCIIALFLTVSSCGDEPKANDENVTAKAGETFTVGAGAYSSEEPLIASVSGSTVTCLRVGKTRIIGEKNYNVEVSGKYNMFTVPFLKFGSTKEQVKNGMKGAKLENEVSDGLLYSGIAAEKYIMYIFKNGKLTGSMLMVETSYLNELTGFVKERYVYKASENDVHLYQSIDKKYFAGLTAGIFGSTTYYTLHYIDGSTAPSSIKNFVKSSKLFE